MRARKPPTSFRSGGPWSGADRSSGGRIVACAQLEHLLAMSERDHITIQVIPCHRATTMRGRTMTENP
ncbi:Scr1 family TA system antitoxin-like transcriptional regulator [Streptomyces sp. NPDC004838]